MVVVVAGASWFQQLLHQHQRTAAATNRPPLLMTKPSAPLLCSALSRCLCNADHIYISPLAATATASATASATAAAAAAAPVVHEQEVPKSPVVAAAAATPPRAASTSPAPVVTATTTSAPPSPAAQVPQDSPVVTQDPAPPIDDDFDEEALLREVDNSSAEIRDDEVDDLLSKSIDELLEGDK
jgi:hypothetical protein